MPCASYAQGGNGSAFLVGKEGHEETNDSLREKIEHHGNLTLNELGTIPNT